MSSVRSRQSQGKTQEPPMGTSASAPVPNVPHATGEVAAPKTGEVVASMKPKSVAGKSTNGISSVKDGGSQIPPRKRVADDEDGGKKKGPKPDQLEKEKQQLEKATLDYQKLVRADEEKTKRDEASKAKRAAEIAAKAPRPAANPSTGPNRAPVPARIEGVGRGPTLNDGNFLFSAPHVSFHKL